MTRRTAPSAAEGIAEVLRRQIIDDYPDGRLVGSADELARRFGASEPTVRQAMRILEAEGLIRVRRGNSGGFFADTPSVEIVSRSASALLRRQGADLADLAIATALVGPEVARLAAENPDPDARRRLLELFETEWGHRGDLEAQDAARTAIRLGRCLGELSGSRSLALTAAILSDLLITLMSRLAQELGQDAFEGLVPQIRDGYGRLARAVSEGDPVSAEREMTSVARLFTTS